MKIKSFMTMMVVATTFVFGMSSCSSDDDKTESPLAAQVVGSYNGNEVVMVMGEESSNDTKTYEFAKVSDSSVDMTIPEIGMGGMMTIPALSVKNIPLKKSDNAIGGELSSFTGTVINAQGDEKAFTITGLVIIFNGNDIVVTYSLKYGNMPMSMDTTFIGKKK